MAPKNGFTPDTLTSALEAGVGEMAQEIGFGLQRRLSDIPLKK